jgi:hypothetical protein
MNQEKIFEEISKMKNLMVSKPGTVISEQETNDIRNDIETFRKEATAFFNTNEQKIVDTLRKYANNASDFKNFTNQYEYVTKRNFSKDLFRGVNPVTRDQKEWNEIKEMLSKIGITLGYVSQDPRKGGSYATFDGLVTQPESTNDENKLQDTEQLKQQQRAQSLQVINNRFIQSAESLGLQNPTMDVQTLQTILNQLNS